MDNYVSEDPFYWDKVYSLFHTFNAPRDSVWNEQPTPFFQRFIPFLKHNGVKKVMDAGCGDGRNLAPFIQAGFQVSGVDFSNAALDYCKKNYQYCSNLELIKSFLENIQLPAGSTDVIICDHVLVHIREVNSAVDHFYRL